MVGPIEYLVYNPSFQGIKIYSLPDVDSDEDEEYKLQVNN